MEKPPTTPKPPRHKKPGPHKETLRQALIELLKIKTLVTMAIIGVMSYLAIIEAIVPETFMTVASAVVTYYFTRKERE
jgi:hypothetical protein